MKKTFKILLFIIMMLSLIFVLTGCGKKQNDMTTNTVMNNNSNNISNENESKTENNDATTNTDKIMYIHDYFDTTKFDSGKFTGVVYDRNSNKHTIKELIGNEQNKTIRMFDSYNGIYDYYFTKDINNEKESIYKNKKETNTIIQFIKSVVGDPTCIYEKNEENKNDFDLRGTGLIYNYEDYILIIQLNRTMSPKDNSILSISIREISIISKNVGQNKIGSAVDIVKDYYKGMVLYGTEITD